MFIPSDSSFPKPEPYVPYHTSSFQKNHCSNSLRCSCHINTPYSTIWIPYLTSTIIPGRTTPTSVRHSSRLNSTARNDTIQSSHIVNEYSTLGITSENPRSYTQAISIPLIDNLNPSINREPNYLLQNKTWTMVPHQPSMNLLPFLYIFRMKSNGPKSLIVSLGSGQIHVTDFEETFAPVVNYSSIRILLPTVALRDL